MSVVRLPPRGEVTQLFPAARVCILSHGLNHDNFASFMPRVLRIRTHRRVCGKIPRGPTAGGVKRSLRGRVLPLPGMFCNIRICVRSEEENASVLSDRENSLSLNKSARSAYANYRDNSNILTMNDYEHGHITYVRDSDI